MFENTSVSRITLVFVLGVLVGLITKVEVTDDFLWITLFSLIFLVGVSMGLDMNKILAMSKEKILRSFKLVIATVAGSLSGGLITYLILGEPALRYSLAISAGMGWYSFTGTYLTGMDPYLGFLAYLSNVLREIYTYITYPILGKKLKHSSISLGGATTMDTTLPVITSVSGSEAGVLAFIHGALLTLIIPVIVPALISGLLS
ncbi:MAG: lysine exporter LysO family protein [Desulfurococcaceae archaeon TW002]